MLSGWGSLHSAQSRRTSRWAATKRSDAASAAKLGFDAIEVFAPSAASIDRPALHALLKKHGLSAAAFGTGGGWLVHKWHLTHADPAIRSQAREFIRAIIDVAGEFKAPAIIGSMQGKAEGDVTRDQALTWLAAALTGEADPPVTALVVFDTNPVATVPDQNRLRAGLTRPDLFGHYYREPFRLLLKNHQVELEVGVSHQPIPVHFSFAEHDHIEGNLSVERRQLMRDVFEVTPPMLKESAYGLGATTWEVVRAAMSVVVIAPIWLVVSAATPAVFSATKSAVSSATMAASETFRQGIRRSTDGSPEAPTSSLRSNRCRLSAAAGPGVRSPSSSPERRLNNLAGAAAGAGGGVGDPPGDRGVAVVLKVRSHSADEVV